MNAAAGKKSYHSISIGAGAAGLVSSAIIASLGGRAALVERARMGGDCLNTGCVPSKSLIASARLVQRMREAGRWGLPEVIPKVDLKAVFASMREQRARIAPHDSVERFREMGVHVFLGEARFLSPHEIEVEGQVVRGQNFVIATGSRPAIPPIEGLGAVPFYTSETFFDQMRDHLTSMVILGGGPIGCEMAQTLQRLGVAVTLVQRGPRLLPREDEEVSAFLRQVLESEGVKVLTGCVVERVEKGGGVIRLSRGAGDCIAEGEALLIATGRNPNLETLNLGAARVQVNDRGVQVNSFLQSSQPHIFAAGDVAGSFHFTHLADHHARVAAENIVRGRIPGLGRIRALKKVDTSVLPWVTYTSPEIARVGWNEREARQSGRAFDVHRIDLAEVDRYIVERETAGFVKILTPKGRGEIIGATIVGEHAGELIHHVTWAMKHRISLKAISSTIHAYPTFSEAVRKVADTWSLEQISPAQRKILSWLFRI